MCESLEEKLNLPEPFVNIRDSPGQMPHIIGQIDIDLAGFSVDISDPSDLDRTFSPNIKTFKFIYLIAGDA